MSYEALPARMATVVAFQPHLVAMWDGPVSCGSLHVARREVGRPVPVADGEPRPPELVRGWDGVCEKCGARVPWGDGDRVRLSGGVLRMFDTESGRLEPGCLFWAEDYRGRCFHWDNCDGRHLQAVLPNGSYWDIDGRAANCSLPDDRLHRCWVRAGEPPAVTAGKGGRTCSAGAGSIASGDYHGFLADGVFTAG